MSLPLFTETQRFRQPWLWVVLGAATLVSLYAMSSTGTGRGGSVVSGALMVGLLALFWSFRLETRIDEEALRYRLFPLQLRERTIPWETVERAWVRRYRPLREYGGWGLRWGPGGRAVNVSGDEGLQVVLKNGDRLLLGTGQGSRIRTTLEGLARRGKVSDRPPPESASAGVRR